MKALVEILLYHLKTDKAPPLTTNHGIEVDVDKMDPFPDSNILIPTPDFEFATWAGEQSDKILVFSAFPGNNTLILQVNTRCFLIALT